MATSGTVQYLKMDHKQSAQRHVSKQSVRVQVACVSKRLPPASHRSLRDILSSHLFSTACAAMATVGTDHFSRVMATLDCNHAKKCPITPAGHTSFLPR